MRKVSKSEEIKLMRRAEQKITEIEHLVKSIKESLKRIEGS